MNLIWRKISESEYMCSNGLYELEISQWGRKNWAWKVMYNGQVLKESDSFTNVRNLTQAKDRCRHQAEYHEKKSRKENEYAD